MAINRRRFIKTLAGLLAGLSVVESNATQQWIGADAVIRQRSCKIVGVGRAGCNWVMALSSDAVFNKEYVTTEFIGIDLGKNSLKGVKALNRASPDRRLIKIVQLSQFTKSRINHNHAEVLRMREALRPMLADAQIVILLAGTAGNTGSSVTPIVARLAHEMGAMTIVAATTPRKGEGEIRVRRSIAAVQALKCEANSVECFSAQALIKEVSDDICQDDFLEIQNQQVFAYIRDLMHKHQKVMTAVFRIDDGVNNATGT